MTNDTVLQRVFVLDDLEAKNLINLSNKDVVQSRIEVFYLNKKQDRVSSIIKFTEEGIGVSFNITGYFGSFFIKRTDPALKLDTNICNIKTGVLSEMEGYRFEIHIQDSKILLLGSFNWSWDDDVPYELFLQYNIPEIEYVSVVRNYSTINIKKYREFIMVGDKNAYIDFYDHHKSFPLLHILFNSEEEMQEYTTDYIKQEVTDVYEYSDEYLALI